MHFHPPSEIDEDELTVPVLNNIMHKGRSYIYKGKEFNEIELLYSSSKKQNINRTITERKFTNFSPNDFHLKEKEHDFISDRPHMKSL